MTHARYTKDGRSVRVEIDNGTRSVLSLEERGEAVERGSAFECTTLPGPTTVTPDQVAPIPTSLVEALEREDDLERATIVAGAARHEMEIDGETTTWREQSVRLYASIVNRRHRLRCELDRGGPAFANQWWADLDELRDAVAAFNPDLIVTSPVVLEPAVAAAIIATIWSGGGSPSGPSLVQAPTAGARDGYGTVLAEETLRFGEGGSAWFRPSYRIRPRLLPHSIDIDSEGSSLNETESRAIALTSAIGVSTGRLRVPCLVIGPDGVSGATLEIDPRRWKDEIEAGSERKEIFPLLAGVWGRRLLFRGPVSH